MEPKTQVEIQLGHMCNNRCVFCVSGQQTAQGRARPMPVAPFLEEITRAFEAGHRKLTLLGGEPTLQPFFLDVVRHAVALGYEEIVLFTNGVKTAREAVIDEILATGGNFTWRISIQGATKEAHEATTLKDGSFDRIVRSMDLLHAKGERLTVNMCVVQSNFASVDVFPALLLSRGVTQLHLDMVRPSDAGERTEAELRAMIPRYTDMVPALERMIAGFPAGYDVNVGNLPYCVAPHLAPYIHHDGERTYTIAIDGEREISKPWDKYLVKRRDKAKPASCSACLFESRCSGVFEAYKHFYGEGELVPVDAAALREADPARHFLVLHLRPIVASLAGLELAPPFTRLDARETGEAELRLTLEGPDAAVLSLRAPGSGAASCALFSLHVERLPADPAARAAAVAATRAIAARLFDAAAAAGFEAQWPLGDDTFEPVAPSIGSRLARLRDAAPFAPLAWRTVSVLDAGRRAELGLEGPGGERAVVWLADEAGRATGGYRLEAETPTDALVAGLGALMAALRAPARAAQTTRSEPRTTP